MLDLRRNRVDYTGGLLSPPPSYHLESAVATTYSLDLETLLAVLLPLAIDGEAPDAPEAFADGPLLLRALWRAAPRLTIFHQTGQILAPNRSTPLHALLDRILVPVALPLRRGTVPAFHPKTWTLEFRNADGASLYRVLVLSRNLTRDDSLDIALALESDSDRRQSRRTKPLLDFLAFLGRNIPPELPHASEHARRIAHLSKGLAAHPLVLKEDAVWKDFDLLPLFDENTSRIFATDPLFSGHPGRVVAMSPFLSSTVIDRLAHRADSTPVLLTRPDAYANLGLSVQESVEGWALKDSVASPETSDSETTRDRDLHAKLYLRESTSETVLLLGSANATDSGLNRNAEFMVRLRCKPEDYGCERFLRDLFGKNPDTPENPFDRLQPGSGPTSDDEAAQADRDAAQSAIDAFCLCNAAGYVEGDGVLHAIVVDVPSGFELPSRIRQCTLRPLPLRADAARPAKGKLRFGGLALAALSPMFVLAAETDTCTVARVVRIPLEGLDEAARDTAAIQAVVDAHGGWGACLRVFFSPEPYTAAAELLEPSGEASAHGTSASRTTTGLYEDMLRTVAEPGGAERFAEMDLDAILARQAGPEAARTRELLSLFRSALTRKGNTK